MKGVLHTHSSLTAMMEDQVEAWGWQARDAVLHVLPLDHLHGIVNTLNVPFFCGAKCRMLPQFDAEKVSDL